MAVSFVHSTPSQGYCSALRGFALLFLLVETPQASVFRCGILEKVLQCVEGELMSQGVEQLWALQRCGCLVHAYLCSAGVLSCTRPCPCLWLLASAHMQCLRGCGRFVVLMLMALCPLRLYLLALQWWRRFGTNLPLSKKQMSEECACRRETELQPAAERGRRDQLGLRNHWDCHHLQQVSLFIAFVCLETRGSLAKGQ